MTLDELIKQYEWPWETSIDLIRKDIDCYTIYAFSIKYYEETGEVETRYLQIKGKFKIVEKEVADEKDMFVSLANINKHDDGSYELWGTGDSFRFYVESDLEVTILEEEEYNNHTFSKVKANS